MNPWFETLQNANESLKEQGLIRRLKLRSTPNGPTFNIDGESFLSFASNDYLGLSNHPSLKKAMTEGAHLYGVGSGASALISGHSNAHDLLETKLAKTQEAHIPEVKACFINTGFMANVAMMTALASLGKVSIFSDELNHASIIDGIKMAKAQSKANVYIYPHNDLQTLEKLMKEDSSPHQLIVTDSVFSMDGDFARVKDLVVIAEKNNALLYIDDAHGFGIFGQHGHGTLEHENINSPNVLYMGTLGKAVGVSGAFIAAHQLWIDWLIQKSRPVIYSTSPSPALAHTVLKSIELIESHEGSIRRNQLFELISFWKKNAHFNSWSCLPSVSAIQPLIIGDNYSVLRLSEQLKLSKIWVPAIRPPTVPKGTARLRITFNADHSISDIENLIDALKRCEDALA